MGTIEPGDSRLRVKGNASIDGTLTVGGITNLHNTVTPTDGDYKEAGPDSNMHITHDCIVFGGKNSGLHINSAQLSAGKHQANSLNIMGMSTGTDSATRRVDIYAEGGLFVRGGITYASRGLIFDVKRPHIDKDGALYRHTNKHVYLTVAGRFYIRSINSSNVFEFNADTGNAYAKKFHDTSDRKLKTNIKAETGILKRLLKLEVKNYQWKDRPEEDARNIGFIAQDVEPVFPELVGEITDPDTNETSLTLQYGNFGVLAIGGLNELQAEMTTVLAEQSRRIEALQKRIDKLEKPIIT